LRQHVHSGGKPSSWKRANEAEIDSAFASLLENGAGALVVEAHTFKALRNGSVKPLMHDFCWVAYDGMTGAKIR
jgi:hypothetical protein